MKNRSLVVGSVAFDVVFAVRGTIRERIAFRKGRLGRQNLMFTAGAKEQRFGGTGANIAYGLGLLGARPILFSSAGADFAAGFKEHLVSRGVETQVHIEGKGSTGTFYGMSDARQEQIGVWQPNAHAAMERISIAEKLGRKRLASVSVAIFSPGTPRSILKHMKEVRGILGKKLLIIFDPGQIVASYDRKLLTESLKLSDIFIGNEVEIRETEVLLGCSKRALFSLGPKAVIETKGDEGSILYEKSGATQIPVVKPRKVVETTGAGDSYRAGLIFGLLQGKDLAAACRIGACVGARSVEYVGGQTYAVNRRDIMRGM